MRRITVHPGFNPLSSAYFLQGLNLIDGVRLRYSSKPFPEEFSRARIDADFSYLFLIDDSTGKRIVVDPFDSPRWYDAAMAWCDVYGKVNIDPERETDPGIASKLVPAAPHFPVRHESSFAFARRVLTKRIPDSVTKIQLKAQLWKMPRYRVRLSDYEPGRIDGRRVWFESMYYRKERECNELRAAFMRACREHPNVVFEGGFRKRGGVDIPADLAVDMMQLKNIDYVRWVQRNLFVFNNPSCMDAYTWRLGEYLALGKAIISTPPKRLLIAPLEHGVHAHIVEPTPEAIREGVNRLASDEPYRRRLETNARAYFETFCHPKVMLQRLLDHAA